MAQIVEKDLVIDEAFDISRFTEKSLVVHPGASGDYDVEISNDGTIFLDLVTGIVADTFLRGGRGATDIPLAVKFIKITEDVAGTDPTFKFLGLDSA
jgi:hypothetical protein